MDAFHFKFPGIGRKIKRITRNIDGLTKDIKKLKGYIRRRRKLLFLLFFSYSMPVAVAIILPSIYNPRPKFY
jgi:hypothetical protein